VRGVAMGYEVAEGEGKKKDGKRTTKLGLGRSAGLEIKPVYSTSFHHTCHWATSTSTGP
jgi:uncharacterized spore protein YtfJ